jgi:hypothetical protein
MTSYLHLDPPRRYPAAGYCIYCGTSEGRLTDEHIIPYGLGGTGVLPHASCDYCAKVTSAFELKFARHMYGNLRRRMQFPSRRQKKHGAAAVSISFADESGVEREELITPAEYPKYGIGLHLPLPGLLTAAPMSDRNPQMDLKLWGNRSEIAAFAASRRGSVQLRSLLDWNAFNRQIAKIAHAYAVASAGPGVFDAVLPPLILGQDAYFSHYVGGEDTGASPLLNTHHLELGGIEVTAGMHYAFVRMRLFAFMDLPSYFVVVGRVPNVDAFSTAVASRNPAEPPYPVKIGMNS